MPTKKGKTGKLRNLKRPSVSAAKADKVKGGAEPITEGPSRAEPINELRRR